MKKLIGIILLVTLVAVSCAPKPHYLTREGKRKIKYYNDVYYGRQKQDFRN